MRSVHSAVSVLKRSRRDSSRSQAAMFQLDLQEGDHVCLSHAAGGACHEGHLVLG